MPGLIFNVKRYSIHDGPGIRVTFFMKGCPLKCIWCHNPEGITPYCENVTITRRIGNKEFSKTEEVGKYYTVEEILTMLESEKIFIQQSGGGVTFSGGEPLLQFDFLKEALMKCKLKGYHTAVDTSGSSSADNFKSIIPYTDLFLFDIKHLDDVRHREFTGVSNKSILDNFRLLVNCGKEIMVRIPVIPGYNDDPLHLNHLKDFLSETKTATLKAINLLPYHKTGSSKYRKFKLPYKLEKVEPPSKERMNELKLFFSETGIKVRIGG